LLHNLKDNPGIGDQPRHPFGIKVKGIAMTEEMAERQEPTQLLRRRFTKDTVPDSSQEEIPMPRWTAGDVQALCRKALSEDGLDAVVEVVQGPATPASSSTDRLSNRRCAGMAARVFRMASYSDSTRSFKSAIQEYSLAPHEVEEL